MEASVGMSRNVGSVEQAGRIGGHRFWEPVVRERDEIDGRWALVRYDRRSCGRDEAVIVTTPESGLVC